MDLKVGDKLIYTHRSWLNEIIKVKQISKVNKSSYKLDDGTLVSKDMKTKHKSDSLSTVKETFELYTVERWSELKDKMELRRYAEWVNRLTRANDLNIDFMKKYINEKGVE